MSAAVQFLIAACLALCATFGVASACSPPPSWQDTGFWVIGDSDWSQPEVTVRDVDRLVLRTERFDVPTFADFAPLLTVEVTGPTGVVPGRLASTPVIGHVVWIPDAPLQDGATYTVWSQVEDSWNEDGRTTTVHVDAQQPAPVDTSVEVTPHKFEHEVRGECLDESVDSCGAFCERHAILRTEMRIQLDVEIAVSEGHWPSARAIRVAGGVDAREALAILDRTPFAQFGRDGNRSVDVAAYRTWPSDQVCGAVEVRDVTGAVLLREARCVEVVPDPALSSDIAARLGRPVGPAQPRAPEPVAETVPLATTGGTGGCQTSGADAPVMVWGLLGLLALRRRRR